MKHTVISMAMCAILAVPAYAQRGNVNGRMPDVIGQAVSIAGGLDVLATNGCYQKTGGVVSGLITANGGLVTTGAVGIGTSTPIAPVQIGKSGQVLAANLYATTDGFVMSDQASVAMRLICVSATLSSAPGIVFMRGAGTDISTPLIVVDNSVLGQFNFQGFDGTTRRNAASIRSEVDGTPGAADMPARIVMATTPDGTAASVDCVWIKNDGKVGIGTSAPPARLSVNGNLRVEQAQTNAGALVVQGATTLTNTTVNGNIAVYGWRGDPIYYENGTLTGTNVFWRWVFVGGSINSNSLQMICATNPVTYPTPQTGTTNAFYIAPATL